MEHLSINLSTTKVWRLVSVLSLALCSLNPPSMRGQSVSTITLSSSSVLVDWPNPIAFTATVKNGTQPVYPGSISFCVATATTCHGASLLGSSQLTASGTAKFTTVLGVGAHSVKAVFSGTNTVASSTSAAVSVSVGGKNATTTSLTATGQAGNYALTAKVSASSFIPPTGQVTFFTSVRGFGLGNATLKPGSPVLDFKPSSLGGTGLEPIPLASADFNGDGAPDIVAGNFVFDNNENVKAYTLTLFLSKAAGTYAAPTLVRLPQIVYGMGTVVTGDFNNDGFADIVVTGDPNALTLLKGDGTGNFSSVTSELPTPYHPNAIAVADFNRDGNSDLAVTDQFANAVWILLGDGKGSFAGNPVATGYFPYAITAGDFNGDGKPDLAIPNYFGNSVTILLGNGSGGFTARAPLDTGIYPDAIVATDLNRDGKLDLAVVDQFSKTVSIFLGTGAGAFAPPTAASYQPPVTGSSPSAIVSADWNGDGIPDLAVGCAGSAQLTVLVGKGDGTFAAPANFSLNSGTGQMVATDVNGDGKTDIVIAGPNTNSVVVGLNAFSSTSTGTLSAATVPGIGQQKVQATYLGDSSNATSPSSPITLTGTPVASTLALTTNPVSNAAAGQPVQLTVAITPAFSGAFPLNNQVVFLDGTTQIAAATIVNFNPLSVNVALAAGTHNLSARLQGDNNTFLPANSNVVTLTSVAQVASTTTLASSANSVARGTPVTLTATVSAGGTTIQRGVVNFCNAKATTCTGSGLLGSAALNAAGPARLKLLLPVGATSVKAVFPGALPNLSSASTPLTVTVTGVYPTRTALKVTGTTGNYTMTATVTGAGPALSGSVSFLDTTNQNLSLGSSALTSVVSNSFAQSARVQFAAPGPGATLSDVNGDGKPDIIARTATSVQVLLGNGDGTFGAPILTAGSYREFIAGDFNGDGKPDIAAIDANKVTVNILLGNGNGTFTFKASIPMAPATFLQLARAFPMVAADFDRDGILDLAVGNADANIVEIHLGKGDGTFTGNLESLTGPTPLSLATADLDGDGKLDIAIVDQVGVLGIALGNGNGSFHMSPYLFPLDVPLPGSQPPQVEVGDFNGDGNPDLAINNLTSKNILVVYGWGNGQYTSSGVTIPNVVPSELVVADFNNDGFSDLFVVDGSGQNQHRIALGSNLAALQPQAANGVAAASGIATGDLNGDGFPDLVYAEGSTGFLDAAINSSVKTATRTGVVVHGSGNHQIVASYGATTPYGASASSAQTVVGVTP